MAEEPLPQPSSAPSTDGAAPSHELDFDATLAFLEEQAGQSPVAENLRQLPSYVSRGLIYLIVSFLVVALIYAAVGQVPVIRTARGVVVPEGNLKQIQSDCEGIVRHLAVNEGDQVLAGDVLAEIDSREVVTQLTALRLAQQKLANVQRDYDTLLPLRQKQLDSQQEVLRNKEQALHQAARDLRRREMDLARNRRVAHETRELEKEQLDEEVLREEIETTNAQSAIDLAAEEFEATTKLKARKVVSELQSRTVELALELARGKKRRCESVLAGARKNCEIAAQKYAALELGFDQTAAELAEEVGQNEIAVKSVSEELAQKAVERKILDETSAKELEQAKFEFQQAREAVRLNFPGISDAELEKLLADPSGISNRTLLRAPQNGRIGKRLVRNSGEAVSRGQPVMTLIPTGDRFRVEILVANRDVGLLKDGMKVRLRFDAFPHSEHGALQGRLEKIVPDPEGDSSGAESYYRGYVSLSQDSFRVKGRQVPLLAGMTLTAEIETERQTLLQLLLKPLIEMQSTRLADPAVSASDSPGEDE